MRTIKMLGIAAVMALALTAFGAASAQASVKVYSCEGKETNCQPATMPAGGNPGATFTAKGTVWVSDGIMVPNQCTQTYNVEVLDNESEGTSDRIELRVSGASLTGCTMAAVTLPKQPWIVATNSTDFLANHTLRFDTYYYVVNTSFGLCEYGIVAGLSGPKWEWTNDTVSWGNSNGGLKRVGGNIACGYRSFNGGVTVSKVSDSGNPSANNIVIK